MTDIKEIRVNNNFNYQEIVDQVGEELFKYAYNYCVEMASEEPLQPTYFTDSTSFQPHAWAVAAVAGILHAVRYPDEE